MESRKNGSPKAFLLTLSTAPRRTYVRLSGLFPRLRAFFFVRQRADNYFVYTLRHRISTVPVFNYLLLLLRSSNKSEWSSSSKSSTDMGVAGKIALSAEDDAEESPVRTSWMSSSGVT